MRVLSISAASDKAFLFILSSSLLSVHLYILSLHSRSHIFFIFSTSYPSQITGLAHTSCSRMDTLNLPVSTCFYLHACLPVYLSVCLFVCLWFLPGVQSMYSFSRFASTYCINNELYRLSSDDRANWRTIVSTCIYVYVHTYMHIQSNGTSESSMIQPKEKILKISTNIVLNLIF